MALLIILAVGITGWLIYRPVPTKQAVIPAKPKLIGLVYHRQHIDAMEGLKQGMKKLGYTDKDIAYDEVKIIPGPNLDTDLKNAIRKMIADKVDVLFVSLEHTARIAINLTKEANSDMPIVFLTRFHDPVAFGIVESYKSSGNNATGVAINMIPTTQKTLLFIKEINPNAKKVGVFTEGFMIPPNNSDDLLKELKNQAPRFGLSIVEYKTQKSPTNPKENWHEIGDKIKPGEIDAIVHLPVHFFDSETPGPGQSQEADELLLAQRLRIPHAVPSEDLPTGGNFSFNDDFNASAGQAAVMIQKILNGTKPKDIPIEFGTKSLLILDLKRAQEAGFQFPQSMLSIANQKIDK